MPSLVVGVRDGIIKSCESLKLSPGSEGALDIAIYPHPVVWRYVVYLIVRTTEEREFVASLLTGFALKRLTQSGSEGHFFWLRAHVAAERVQSILAQVEGVKLEEIKE